MTKQLWPHARPYALWIALGVACSAMEAVFELLIPLVMSDIVDVGSASGDQAYILRKGGLMAPSLIALGLAGFSLYPVAMAWGCEEASRDELVTMNQLLLLSYSLGTLAGPSLTSFLMQRYSDNWMPMVIALVALSFMPVLMLGGGHGRRKLSR